MPFSGLGVYVTQVAISDTGCVGHYCYYYYYLRQRTVLFDVLHYFSANNNDLPLCDELITRPEGSYPLW